MHSIKYAVVGKDGSQEWKIWAGFLYADDVCLKVSSEEDTRVIICGTLAWYQREHDDLDYMHNGFGRWLWEVGMVRNESVRGEPVGSYFTEREVKGIVDLASYDSYQESMVSGNGRACLREIGYKSRWWARFKHMCEQVGLREPVDL